MPKFKDIVKGRTLPTVSVEARRFKVPVTDPNDSRYMAYMDSLRSYNTGKDIAIQMGKALDKGYYRLYNGDIGNRHPNEYEMGAKIPYGGKETDNPFMSEFFIPKEILVDYEKNPITPHGAVNQTADIFRKNYNERTPEQIEQGKFRWGFVRYPIEYYQAIENGLKRYESLNPNIEPIGIHANVEGMPSLRFKKPTHPPMREYTTRAFEGTPLTPQGMPQSVRPTDPGYTHIEKSWGRNWRSTSGQDAPKGGGYYYQGFGENGSTLYTPEEYKGVSERISSQKGPQLIPKKRIYRDGGVINFRPELPASQQSTISSRIDPEKELRLKKIQSEIDLLEKRERAYKEASPPHQVSPAPGGPVEHEDYWNYGNQVKRNISTSKESIKNVGQNMIMPSLPYGRIFKAAKPVTGVMPRVLGNQGNPDHFNAMMGAILANTLQTDIAGENTSLISHAKQYYKKTPAAKRSKERIQEKMKSDELNWFQKRIFKKISE